MIISQSAAELLFPGEDPLDKQVRPATAAGDNWSNIIGVVEDVLIDDLRREKPEPTVYLPAVSGSPAYVMKSARAEQLEPEVRAIIREVIPESPMYRVFTMKRLAANAMAGLSFTMSMVSIAAALALILGAVGLYGVLSYRVTRRAQEIGVRMALGAQAESVRWMFVRQGAQVALLGVITGALAAAGLDDVHPDAVVQRRSPGRDGFCRDVGRHACGGAAGELHPGAARLASGSRGGAAGGVAPVSAAPIAHRDAPNTAWVTDITCTRTRQS